MEITIFIKKMPINNAAIEFLKILFFMRSKDNVFCKRKVSLWRLKLILQYNY